MKGIERFVGSGGRLAAMLALMLLLSVGSWPGVGMQVTLAAPNPEFAEGYPTLTWTSDTTATLKVKEKNGEAGKVYYAVGDQGSLLITNTEVKNGIRNSVPIANKGEKTFQENEEAVLSLTGLNLGGGSGFNMSRVHVVIEIGSYLTPVKTLEFKDNVAPVFEPAYPYVTEITDTSALVMLKTNKAGTVIAQRVNRGDPAPDAQQMKNALGIFGSTLPYATVIADTEATISLGNGLYPTQLLAPEMDYDLYVLAMNNNGATQDAPVKLEFATAVAAPSGVTAVPGDSQITLSWEPRVNAVSYAVYYTDNFMQLIYTLSEENITGTSQTVTGLTNGTPYIVGVKTFSAKGWSNLAYPIQFMVTPITIPAAPTQVAAVAGDAQAVVSWTKSPTTVSQAVYYYQGTTAPVSDTDWVLAQGGQVVADSPYTVTGLTNGLPYVFAVRAVNEAGSSGFSEPSASVTPIAAPSAPAQVTGIPGDAKATVQWSAVDGASSYALYQYEGTSAPSDEQSWIAVPDADTLSTTSYTVTGLTNGKFYVFAVRATNPSGTSGYSAPSTTVIPVAPPLPPAEVSAVAGNAQVELDWMGSSNTLSYSVYQYAGDSAPINEQSWQLVNASVTGKKYTVTGLTNGTSYVFAVKSHNLSGSSGFSSPTQSVTPTAPPEPPNVPAVVFATAGDGQADVSWTPTANTVSYSVYFYVGTAAPQQTSDWTLASSTVTSSAYTVTGLTNGTPYVFTVKAANEHGTSDYAVASSPVVPQAGQLPQPPEAPEQVHATAGDSQATVSWQGVGGAQSYDVYYYEGTAAPQQTNEWQLAVTEVVGKMHTVTGLTNGTSYVFAVKAVNAQGKSPYSPASLPVVPQGAVIEPEPEAEPEPEPNEDEEPTPGSGAPGVTGPVNAPGDPGTSTGPVTKERISADVGNAAGTTGTVISTLEITRSRENGSVKDELKLDAVQTETILKRLAASNSQTATIVLPDTMDEVSEWSITIGKESAALLAEQGVELVISAPGAQVSIPSESLLERNEDIYFRIIPVRSDSTLTQIEQRAMKDETLAVEVNVEIVRIVGRPMQIETNVQQRPVTIVLPLEADAAADADRLGVYIEHSDGEKQLILGEVVEIDGGRLGIRFVVHKFSTFSIVLLDRPTTTHIAYIDGYEDGTFRPAAHVTRAEVAAMISRIPFQAVNATEDLAFHDVSGSHWASNMIADAARVGLMTGYADGSFKPDQAVTRAELADVLLSLINDKTEGAVNSFTDLGAHWAEETVARLKSAGIVNGYEDGSFRPDTQLTRAEAVVMLNRALGIEPMDGTAPIWKDVSSDHWAYGAIQAVSTR